MGQKVYTVSQHEYSNILGIFTNIRQCRKYILKLLDQENIILHEIRLNEPEKGRIDMTKLLAIKEVDLINMEKQKAEKQRLSELPESEKDILKKEKKEKKIKQKKEKKEKKIKPKKENIVGLASRVISDGKN